MLLRTVTPDLIPELLQQNARFVRDVSVVQVDIDTIDGPVATPANTHCNGIRVHDIHVHV